MPKGSKGFQNGHKVLSNWGFQKGKNHPNWKGGLWTKEYKAMNLRKWRHEKGINKSYRNPPYDKKAVKKRGNQAYKARKKKGGKLFPRIIQIVYEDNIKRFGTLTCYLCLKSIQFGKDTLDHKISLSKGGTNEYNNLAIACQSCNCRKHTKTEVKYRKEIL